MNQSIINAALIFAVIALAIMVFQQKGNNHVYPTGGNMETSWTTITSENVADILEIQRTTSVLTDGVDTANRDAVALVLADEVNTTIGETERGVSKVKSKEEILTRWRSFHEIPERFVLHHVTSNDRVYFEDKNNATVHSKGVIVLENTPAGEFAETGGTLRGYRWVTYEFGMTRTSDGRKANKVLVNYLVEEFDSLPGSEGN